MAAPDPEAELRAFREKEKGGAVLKVFVTVLVADAIIIAGCLLLAQAFGWSGTALLVPLVVLSMVTGFWYQWKKQRIEREP